MFFHKPNKLMVPSFLLYPEKNWICLFSKL